MSQHHHDIFESRKQFQLERMILFSDAVFAIAITLLIIEIKVPHFEGAVTQALLVKALGDKLPEFIGFAVSFVVIGQFWMSHHRLFGYIKSYNHQLLWLNLLLLFWVVLMPFSTFLNMQYGNLDITWFWYSMNLAVIELCIFLLWRYVGLHDELNIMAGNKLFIQQAYARSLWVFAVFLAGALLTFLPWESSKWVSRFIFFLIFPVMIAIRKYFARKAKKIPASKLVL